MAAPALKAHFESKFLNLFELIGMLDEVRVPNLRYRRAMISKKLKWLALIRSIIPDKSFRRRKLVSLFSE